MIISKKMEESINKQINAEMYSSYLYLSMATYFDAENLKGMASWMKVQAQEEMVHTMKFYSYIYDRGGKVTLKAIDAPMVEWKSPLQVFEAAYDHEQKITMMIHDLVKIARNENDFTSDVFLSWFVNEQIEEEASSSEIVEKIKMVGSSNQVLYLLDKELGARAFKFPASK